MIALPQTDWARVHRASSPDKGRDRRNLFPASEFCENTHYVKTRDHLLGDPERGEPFRSSNERPFAAILEIPGFSSDCRHCSPTIPLWGKIFIVSYAMLLLEIVLLAIVQGIGEFLPISSSGHIVVLATLFEQFGQAFDGEKLTVNIVLHLGTLLAILVFYRRRIISLLTRERRVIGLVIVGTLPAVVIGLWIKKFYGDAFESALLSGFMFPITGLGLLWTARAKHGNVTCADLRYDEALLIGFAQAFAVLPGISRSGATIVAGLARGMRRDEAAAFSFLLAIPAIAGGGVLHLLEFFSSDSPPPAQISAGLLLLGAAISFAVGLAALAWLIRWIEQGRLYLFAWWVLILGPVVIIWQLLT